MNTAFCVPQRDQDGRYHLWVRIEKMEAHILVCIYFPLWWHQEISFDQKI